MCDKSKKDTSEGNPHKTKSGLRKFTGEKSTSNKKEKKNGKKQ